MEEVEYISKVNEEIREIKNSIGDIESIVGSIMGVDSTADSIYSDVSDLKIGLEKCWYTITDIDSTSDNIMKKIKERHCNDN